MADEVPTGDDAPLLDAMALRRLGEAADGYRGETRYLVLDDGPPRFVRRGEPGWERATLRVQTANVVAERPSFRLDLTLLPPGQPLPDPGAPEEQTNIRHRLDALFWSEAAVEKFVLPYYHRVRTPARVAALHREFMQRDVLAIGHVPPTEPSLEADGGGFVVARPSPNDGPEITFTSE